MNGRNADAGGYVFDNPVDIEPPFEAFTYHFRPNKPIDDGTKPSVLDGLAKMFSGKKEVPVQQEPEANKELVPIDYVPEGALCIFHISLPKGYEVDKECAEQLLLMLSVCKQPVSFEIIANAASITIQFVCREPDDIHLFGQLKAYFPDGIISEKTESVSPIIVDDQETCIIELGLQQEFMRPLASVKNFTIDPLVGIFGLLEHLKYNDQGVIQILFKGAVDPWAGSILASVTDSEGDSFFLDMRRRCQKWQQEKISCPLYGVAYPRVIGQSDINREKSRSFIAQNLGKHTLPNFTITGQHAHSTFKY